MELGNIKKILFNRLKYFYKIKFKIVLISLIIIAIFLAYLIVSYIFFNSNILELDFERKSYLLASLGIITSALIASFSILSNNETSTNKEDYKNLKYMVFQLDVLEKYIDYSTNWVEKFSSDEKEILRLNEFLNNIYDIKKEISSRDLIFTYSRGTQDFGVATIMTYIDDLYSFKNSYGVTKDTLLELDESLHGLSSTIEMVTSKLSEKLDIYEKNSLYSF